ncbi:hypothetical protein CH366_19395 [Leptospira harrisiae]|nr:hypothetical protein CH366_19395 [Leptospira harrisiae]
MVDLHDFGGRCQKYTLDRNSDATIKKVLKEDQKSLCQDKEKSKKINKNLGDQLKADSIFFLVKELKTLKFELISNHTGTHSNNQLTTKSQTYAEIKTPFKFNKSLQ